MVDLDDDDYPEKFVGSIVFPSDAANLKNIELYVFFSYGIRSIIKMQMNGFTHIQVQSTTGISHATIKGEIKLR